MKLLDGTELDIEACVQLCLDAQLSWAYIGNAEKAELFGKLASALPKIVKHIPNLPHEWEAGFPDEGVL